VAYHICVVSASDVSTKTHRFTSGLTYFSRSQGSNVKSKDWSTMEGGTNRNRCTQRLVMLRAQTY